MAVELVELTKILQDGALMVIAHQAGGVLAVRDLDHVGAADVRVLLGEVEGISVNADLQGIRGHRLRHVG